MGTLAGSGLLHLMPHTYGMTIEAMGDWIFVYKASTIFGGAYLFLCLERLLKTLSDKRTAALRKKQQKQEKHDLPPAVHNSNNNSTNTNGGAGAVDLKVAKDNEHGHGHSHHGLEVRKGG